jgi:4-amino-4-deoxy-L-arabinose transferase-like glycosyltransferase
VLNSPVETVRLHAADLLLLLLLSLMFGLLELPMPVGLDQGILMYVATDIVDGGVPYLTTWDHKPPGAHYLVALAFTVLGKSVMALRLFDVVYVFLVVAATYRIGAQLFAREAGLWAGILFLIAYFTRFDWWNKCQVDEYMTLPILLAVSIVLGDPGGTRRRTAVLAGVCMGAAFLVKFIAVVVVLPILYWYLRHVSVRRQPRRVLVDAGLFLGGFLVPNIILAGWLWWTGAWVGFVDAVFVFNSGYVLQGRQSPWVIVAPFQHLWLVTALAVLAMAALLLPSATSRDLASRLSAGRPGVGFACLLLAAFALEVMAQGKFYAYHTIPVVLAVTLLAGLGLHLVTRGTRAAARRFWPALAGNRATILPALLLATCTLAPFARIQAFKLVSVCGLLDGAVDHEAYYRAAGGAPDGNDFSYVSCRQAADYVRERTAATDLVYVWGFDPLVNVLAGRRMPTRYSYNTPLIAPWRKARWRQEFMADIRADPPRYLLVVCNDQHPWTTGRNEDSYQIMMTDFAVLARFVSEHYELETTIRNYRIYRHRP